MNGKTAFANATTAPPPPASVPWVETPSSTAPQQRNADGSQASTTATRSSIPVACVSCRSRHLKCDGATRCSRCISENVNCVYLKSRRGWKGPRRTAKATIKQPPTQIAPGECSRVSRSVMLQLSMNGFFARDADDEPSITCRTRF